MNMVTCVEKYKTYKENQEGTSGWCVHFYDI